MTLTWDNIKIKILISFFFQHSVGLVRRGLGALGSVHGLDVLPLLDCPLVASEPPLSELVDPLVSGGASSVDHVEDATLVGGEPDDLADELADGVHALVLGSLARTVHLGNLGDLVALVLSLG